MSAGNRPSPLDYSREPDPTRSPWRRLKKVLLGVLAVFGVLLAASVIHTLSWVIPLQDRLAKASAHAAVLRQQVAGDARFKNVWFEDFTGDGGVLMIGGYVDSTADLASLKQIVNSSSPPVAVRWRVDDVSSLARLRTGPATTGAATLPTRDSGDRDDSSR